MMPKNLPRPTLVVMATKFASESTTTRLVHSVGIDLKELGGGSDAEVFEILPSD